MEYISYIFFGVAALAIINLFNSIGKRDQISKTLGINPVVNDLNPTEGNITSEREASEIFEMRVSIIIIITLVSIAAHFLPAITFLSGIGLFQNELGAVSLILSAFLLGVIFSKKDETIIIKTIVISAIQSLLMIIFFIKFSGKHDFFVKLGPGPVLSLVMSLSNMSLGMLMYRSTEPK